MAFTTWPAFGLDSDVSRLGNELVRALGWVPQAAPGVFPAVNIYDDGETFLVRAEVPGVDRESLEITTRGEQVTIRGERVVQTAEGPASYHRREREGGRFRRVVTLPQRVDGDKVSATYREGVLEVTLPRVSEEKPRKIQIG
jgi:HSP20 family protein